MCACLFHRCIQFTRIIIPLYFVVCPPLPDHLGASNCRLQFKTSHCQPLLELTLLSSILHVIHFWTSTWQWITGFTVRATMGTSSLLQSDLTISTVLPTGQACQSKVSLTLIILTLRDNANNGKYFLCCVYHFKKIKVV